MLFAEIFLQAEFLNIIGLSARAFTVVFANFDRNEYN